MARSALRRALSLILATLTFASMCTFAQVTSAQVSAAPTSEEAQRVAKALLELTFNADRLNATAKNLGRTEIDAASLQTFVQRVSDELAARYAERFTVVEMKTAIEFFRSPTGRKFLSATPELTRDATEIVRRHLTFISGVQQKKQ